MTPLAEEGSQLSPADDSWPAWRLRLRVCGWLSMDGGLSLPLGIRWTRYIIDVSQPGQPVTCDAGAFDTGRRRFRIYFDKTVANWGFCHQKRQVALDTGGKRD